MADENIQAKIQLARRDAETLKDRIKRRKDELADTTRAFRLADASSPRSIARPR